MSVKLLGQTLSLFVVILSRCINCAPPTDRAGEVEVGFFWHITDMHWDPTYAGSTASPGVSCGQDAPPSQQLGSFGNYACDSPWKLINESVYAMKEIKPDVDFIIWTGDDTPHNADISAAEVAAIIGNLTDKILECFPNTTAFPVLGNHDWSPKHQLPPRPDPLYDAVAELWAPWLRAADPQADESFRNSGYYTLPINNKLRLIGLNTNLYYKNDAITEDMPDPACQFQWLDDLLTASQQNATKVILIGHVPPGLFEKHNYTYWYRPFFNNVFLQLLRKHSDVIASAHFAHHHTDTFRVVADDNGKWKLSFKLALLFHSEVDLGE
jgi:sphingomyelin phosphodiesterase acid-like 3